MYGSIYRHIWFHICPYMSIYDHIPSNYGSEHIWTHIWTHICFHIWSYTIIFTRGVKIFEIKIWQMSFLKRWQIVLKICLPMFFSQTVIFVKWVLAKHSSVTLAKRFKCTVCQWFLVKNRHKLCKNSTGKDPFYNVGIAHTTFVSPT